MACTLIDAYVIVIVLRMVLSWFPLSPGSPMEGVGNFLRKITEPLLGPLRRALPPMGGLDLSPMVLIIGLRFVVGRLLLSC